MRTFIALEMPEAFASDIAALSRILKASIEGRFIPADTYHLTLAFLGDIPETDSARAVDAMETACADAPLIALKSDGLGKFGRASDATLWLGITPVPELMQLAERIREELAAQAIAFDGKPLKPHITLARRVRIPRSTLPTLAFPRDDKATAVTLFKSTLERNGATHKPLHTIRLSARKK